MLKKIMIVMSCCMVATCEGMLKVDKGKFSIDMGNLGERYPQEVWEHVFKRSSVLNSLKSFQETCEKEAKQYMMENERIAYEKMRINDYVKSVADEIGLLENNADLQKNVSEKILTFIEEYNKEAARQELYKKAPDFYFCLGIAAYYLSSYTLAPENEKIGEFFKSITSKEMTRENGLELIKKADGENAYFFLQTIGCCE